MKDNTVKYLKYHWLWWSAAVLVLIGTIIVGYLFFHEEEEASSGRLKVEEVYFVMTDQDEYVTNMDIIVFITNEGEKTLSEVKVRAFAIETDSNLARDENEKTLSTVEGKTTIEGTLNIELPNNDTYRVELLVFKEGKLSIRGSGTVNLIGVGQASAYQTNEADIDGDGAMDSETGTGALSLGSSSGLCFGLIILIFIVLVITIVIVVVLRKGKRRGAHSEQGPGSWHYPPSGQVGGQKIEYQHRCPDCGYSTRFIPEFNDWYCEKCRKYLSKVLKPGNLTAPKTEHKPDVEIKTDEEKEDEQKPVTSQEENNSSESNDV